MTGLCHCFVTGLRARTEVECRVRTAAGRQRYECLHREVEIPAESAGVAWMQASKLLCGWSPQPAGAGQAEIVCEAVSTTSASQIGERAHQAILADQIPIIQYCDGEHTRWSMVCGVELSDCAAQALLLLDSLLPGPWAVPYNARLELPSSACAKPTTLTLLSTDGQSWSVSPQQLFVIRRDIAGPDGV